MKILHRFGYYLGGFSIGLILLAFFLKGSGTQIPSCDYMPNARALKNMRTKGYTISDQAKEDMTALEIDTTNVRLLFEDGNVVFSKSEPRQKPCGQFYIETDDSANKRFAAKVTNCEDNVVIDKFEEL
tara:strand:+ start:230 stop:613 length:384 start_codon:yes stop_codon:yes gene_type:complete